MMNIAAIIVLFKHDNAILEFSLSKIEKSVNKIFIINNFKDFSLTKTITDNEKINVTVMPSNLGISAGYNIGLKKAIKGGFSHAFLLDQDSIASEELIPSIIPCMPSNAASISSLYEEYNDYKTIQFKKVSRKNIVQPVEFNIGSGSVISLEILSNIGMFDEAFFMEHYDIEWCFRARQNGFHVYKFHSQLFFHKIGISRKVLLGKSINIHEPIRYYYKSWGLIRLIYNENMPLSWKFKELLKHIMKLIIYPILSNNFLTTFKYMIIGTYDGIRNIQRNSYKDNL